MACGQHGSAEEVARLHHEKEEEEIAVGVAVEVCGNRVWIDLDGGDGVV